MWLNIFYQRRGDFSSLKPYTENFISERDLEMILEQCSFVNNDGKSVGVPLGVSVKQKFLVTKGLICYD